MGRKEFDVVAIGHALVDVLAYVEDDFLHTHNMLKDSMQLVDEPTSYRLYRALQENLRGITLRSGGSAANTAAGVASCGGKAAFIGKVTHDEPGTIFRTDITKEGVHFPSSVSDNALSTGLSIVAVSPDSARSMNTYLGTACYLTNDDIDETLIASSQVFYVEGYLWDREETKKTLRYAMELAQKHGTEVAFSLSDPFCVDRHREEFLEIVQRYATIVFANEDEIISLYQTTTIFEAAAAIQRDCRLAALTRSVQGSLIVTGQELLPIAPVKNALVKDTTGAGDLYASGFLYGLTHNYPLSVCGQLGSTTAAEIISHIGARPEKNLHDLLSTNNLL